MSAFGSVLIYDGDCPFCSAAASALRRVGDVGAVAWDDPAAQAFLDVQFDDVPFALVLVDAREERVYVGRNAASELCDRAGLPVLVGDVLGDNYESVADAVRALSRADGTPDSYHGTLSLADAAADRFDDLADDADGSRVVE